MRSTSGMPVASNLVWAIVVSQTTMPAIVHVIIQAAHDAAGVGLHQDAMAAGRLDVEPDVVVVGVEQVPHGDVAEDDLAVGRGRPGRREGATVRFLGRTGPCSAGSRNRRPSRPVAVASRAFSRKLVSTSALIVTRSRRSSGRPSHLAPAAAAPSAIPFISSRYSESNRRRNRASASSRRSCQASAGALRAAIPGDLADEPGDLGRHQPAVLVAPLVRLSLDVQDDPAGLRVAITRPKPLDGGGVGPITVPRWHSSRDRRPGHATDPAASTIKPVNTIRVQVGMIILGGAGWPRHGAVRTPGRARRAITPP